MDKLDDLLQKRGRDIPPEIALIKDYVRAKFDADVQVAVKDKQIVISAPSAALAGTLRLHNYDLSAVCKTDKKLIFRIGT